MTRLPEDLDRLLHDLRGPLNALAMHAEVVTRAWRVMCQGPERFEIPPVRDSDRRVRL